MTIFNESVAAVTLWGSGLCFLNALTHWGLRDRPCRHALLLGALFVCLGLFLLRSARFEWLPVSSSNPSNVPDNSIAGFWTMQFAWLYWIGPLSWIWLQSTIVSGYRISRREALLLAPGLALLALDLYILHATEIHAVYHNTCLGSRLAIFAQSAADLTALDAHSLPIGLAGLAGIFVYFSNGVAFALSLRALLQLWSPREMPRRVILLGCYLTGGLLTLALLFAGDLFVIDLPRQLALVGITALFMARHIACTHDPELLDGLRRESRRKSYERSALSGLDTDMALARLDELMRGERVYLDEDLSLDRLAAELRLSRHQLSGLLNERLRKNFHSYVNEFRIAAAQRMLVDEPRRSVLSIAGAVGFNSKSSFHTAFQKNSGCTPQQFRARRRASI